MSNRSMNLPMVPEGEALDDTDTSKSPSVLAYEHRTKQFARKLFKDCTNNIEPAVLTMDEFEEFLKMVLLHVEFRSKKLKKKAVVDLSREILITLNANFEFKTTGIDWNNIALLLDSVLESMLLVRARLFERSDEMAADISELMNA